ncbi:MAG: hypothetical protein OXC06_10310 [Acidimicrobiaceae bacterium]|nr:hypothetical protein [Acidimicrobiaceae bacterium]
MTYTLIAVVVFLALSAVGAAARITAHYRHGAHGRPDLEAGHTRVFSPAEARSRARHPSMMAEVDASGSRARTKTRPATLRPVFHIGATPAPERVSPWPSDEHIREEFGLDSADHRGRAA